MLAVLDDHVLLLLPTEPAYMRRADFVAITCGAASVDRFIYLRRGGQLRGAAPRSPAAVRVVAELREALRVTCLHDRDLVAQAVA